MDFAMIDSTAGDQSVHNTTRSTAENVPRVRFEVARTPSADQGVPPDTNQALLRQKIDQGQASLETLCYSSLNLLQTPDTSESSLSLWQDELFRFKLWRADINSALSMLAPSANLDDIQAESQLLMVDLDDLNENLQQEILQRQRHPYEDPIYDGESNMQSSYREIPERVRMTTEIINGLFHDVKIFRRAIQLQQDRRAPNYSTPSTTASVPAVPSNAVGSTGSAGYPSPDYTYSPHRGRPPSSSSVDSSAYASQQGGYLAHSPPSTNSYGQVASEPSTGFQLPAIALASQLVATSLHEANTRSPNYGYDRTLASQQEPSLRIRDFSTPTQTSANAKTTPRSQPTVAGPSEKRTGQVRRVHKEIKSTPGDYEQLDPRYKRRVSKWFKQHRVFKMHWTQPAGREDIDDSATIVTPRQGEPLPKQYEKTLPRDLVRDRRFGQYIYSKIRWFIVVKAGADKCVCVPIITYQGNGASGPEITKSEHAIVYTTKPAPEAHPSELPVGNERPMRTSIRVIPDERGDRLMDMSRIDYGRVYTVEKNVKAMAFGWVHEDSEKDISYDFLNVFLGPEGYAQLLQSHERKNKGEGNSGGEQGSDGDGDEDADEDMNDEDDEDE